jgi:hypothetical protein
MKKAILISLLWTLMAFSQSPLLTGIYKEVARGESVTITWEYPEEIRAKVKVFRIRKGQSPAGAYIAFASVARTESSFSFVPPGSCHVFVSAVWDEVQPDGSTITRETPGSNHVQISVK